MNLRTHISSQQWILHVPVRDADNARDLARELEYPVVACLVLKDHPDLVVVAHEAEQMLTLGSLFTSFALGDGDPQQWSRVLSVACEVPPHHINQLYPTAGYALGTLRSSGAGDTVVNALIEPTGRPGYVSISTGPFSAAGEKAIVPARTAMLLLKDAGVESVKYYPMHGLGALTEFCEIVRLAAEEGISAVEPSGGIDGSNIAKIIRSGLQAGRGKVHIAPHVFGAVNDKETKLTLPSRVSEIHRAIRKELGC